MNYSVVGWWWLVWWWWFVAHLGLVLVFRYKNQGKNAPQYKLFTFRVVPKIGNIFTTNFWKR